MQKHTAAFTELPSTRPPLAGLSGVMILAFALVAGCSGPTSAEPTEKKTPQHKATDMTSPRWKKPADDTLKATLSPLQYRVTQQAGTEPPFQNAYWNDKTAGVYVDITTGEPLFSSKDKFDSGTGWPSFTKPIAAEHVSEHSDRAHGMVRTEVRSRAGDAHLGHLFPDGPGPTGMRYCINSASLRLVPVADLEKEGYGELAPLFGGAAPPALPPFFDTATAKDNACTKPAPGQMAGCNSGLETAILAGGCFWGMEELLRQIDGVLDADVGYTGGSVANPTYNHVKTGGSGHAEAVRVVFDPTIISYEDLLSKWFFRMHDPSTLNRQGNDVGTQYRSAIFTTSPEQRATALKVIEAQNALGKWRGPIVTTVEEAGPYTPAEDYHQDYLVKNPGGYTCHFLRD